MQPNDQGGVEDCTHAGLVINGVNCLNDASCDRTSNGLPLAACCEVPSFRSPGVPCSSCPAGFSNPDASGFCYAGITSGGTWDASLAACRALASSASLAGIYDATTLASVTSNQCAGLLSGSFFWTGLRDNAGSPTAGHTDRAGSYWRWLGTGSVSRWLMTYGTGSWFSGERECHSVASSGLPSLFLVLRCCLHTARAQS